jgi:hypothetical protein
VLLLAFGCFAFAGCQAGHVTSAKALPPLPHRVETIALAPSGGVLADAIGVELFGLGFRVVDTAEFSNLLIRDNLSEIEVSQPQNLKLLHERGIDAILVCKAVARDDDRLESASVRVTSARTGELIAGTTFQGGWGGARGSIADSVMASGLNDAAKQIAEALEAMLRRPISSGKDSP